ncbi:MAG: hypothetical protein ACEB74_10065 [Desulfovibrio aminophilus]|uniref:hypothetical protein n=1 Tax=Desulfovibrio aminophilus TaxID=81425 RepID=UPI0039E78BF7
MAAKFLSLHSDMFCYAGETHIIPLTVSMFGQNACQKSKVNHCIQFLRGQLMTSMVTMPRFSVGKGAHPANLIFDEAAVEQVLSTLRSLLLAGCHGRPLYVAMLQLLRNLLAERDPRTIIGEKTPSNIFAQAEYGGGDGPVPVVVMREPLGVVRSMRGRQDCYADPFGGEIESCIGIYLDYGAACLACLENPRGIQVRYEEMAEDPAKVLRSTYALFGREPEERVIRFVEKGGDKEVADRAPMNYKRLAVNANIESLTPLDAWKIMEFTRPIRQAAGYSDAEMQRMGYNVPEACPAAEVPKMVVPLGGFHPSQADSCAWMQRQGRLVAYMPKAKSTTLRLFFWSSFPDLVTNGTPVELSLFVDGKERDRVQVTKKNGAAVLQVTLFGEDLKDFGPSGHYAILEIRSSLAYAPITACEDTVDGRVVSFVLTSWAMHS